jgi:hypothetical protein
MSFSSGFRPVERRSCNACQPVRMVVAAARTRRSSSATRLLRTAPHAVSSTLGHAPRSRLGLIIVLDQFSRSLTGVPRAHLPRTRRLARSRSKASRTVTTRRSETPWEKTVLLHAARAFRGAGSPAGPCVSPRSCGRGAGTVPQSARAFSLQARGHRTSSHGSAVTTSPERGARAVNRRPRSSRYLAQGQLVHTRAVPR